MSDRPDPGSESTEPASPPAAEAASDPAGGVGVARTADSTNAAGVASSPDSASVASSPDSASAASSPDSASAASAPPGTRDFPMARAVAWLGVFLLLCVLVGVCVGVLWAKVVDPPSYMIGKDGAASLSERGLTAVFGSDAWFAAFGFVVSLGIGVIAWRWFGKLGWPVVIVTILGALVAAVVCWYVGYQIGPGNLTRRMADAKPGDVVPLPITVRSPATLVVWAFGAIIPVLLRASLGRDEEEAQLPPPRHPWKHRRWLRRKRDTPDAAANSSWNQASGHSDTV